VIQVYKISYPAFKEVPSDLYITMRGQSLHESSETIDNTKIIFFVDYRYGHTGEIDYYDANPNNWSIRTPYPNQENASTIDEEGFRGWFNGALSQFSGFSLPISSLLEVGGESASYALSAGFDIYAVCYVGVDTGIFPANLGGAKIRNSLRSIALVSEEDIDSQNLLFQSDDPTNGSKYGYKKALELQNYSDIIGASIPPKGWGNGLYTIDSSIYQDDALYGGIDSLSNTVFAQY
jgi:hypothetical protein